MQTRLLVMDEPTAALSSREVDDLFGIVRQLRLAGCGDPLYQPPLRGDLRTGRPVTVLRDGARF